MSDLLSEEATQMSAEPIRDNTALHFGNWAAAATAAHPWQQHRQQQQQQQQDHSLVGLGRKHSLDVLSPNPQQQQCWGDAMLIDHRCLNHNEPDTTQGFIASTVSNSTAAGSSKRPRTLLNPFMAAAAAISSSIAFGSAAVGHSAAVDCTAASSSGLDASGSFSGGFAPSAVNHIFRFVCVEP